MNAGVVDGKAQTTQTVGQNRNLQKLGQDLVQRYLVQLDEVLVSWGVDVVSRLALRQRLAPFHVALVVPGLCHTHAPDTRTAVDGCAYCERRGNCFAERRGNCFAERRGDCFAQETSQA